MLRVRAPLAACAALVAVMQTATFVAAPFAACCAPKPAAAAAHCCRTGSAGMCPLHAHDRASNSASACRMTCGSKAPATVVLLGSIGVLPRPLAIAADVTSEPFDPSAPALVRASSLVPDPPPPRV
jgi:hypothetical protein